MGGGFAGKRRRGTGRPQAAAAATMVLRAMLAWFGEGLLGSNVICDQQRHRADWRSAVAGAIARCGMKASLIIGVVSLIVIFGRLGTALAQTAAESSASPTISNTGAKPDETDKDEKQVLKTSPSGAFRVVQSGEEFWIESTKSPTDRTRMHSAELVIPEEFRFSPDEHWLYVELHHGSCMSGMDIYGRKNESPHFERVEGVEEHVWREAVKLKVMPRNFDDEGLCAMTRFGGWSEDSARLLVLVRGGEERRETQGRYLYYNTRTAAFELTPYLRKVNAMKWDTVLTCAEPVDPLPDEAPLKQRLDQADKKLNDNYKNMLGKAEKDSVDNLRKSQREWVKSRDAGLRVYLGLFPAKEKEQRRLQFLSDVTTAEVERQETEAADR